MINLNRVLARIACILKREKEMYIGYTREGKEVRGTLKQVMNTPDIEYGTIDLDL